MNIEDAYQQLKDFYGKEKVQTIVFNTHGGLGQNEITGETIIGICIDNNCSLLPQSEQIERNNCLITSRYLRMYLQDKNDEIGASVKTYIETLVKIIDYVEDEKDFVMASCLSAATPAFLSPLQLITESRINMYGVYRLSSFKMDFAQEITYIPRKRGGNNIETDASSVNIDMGTAYITKDKFDDKSLLSPFDMEGNPVDNYAYKFPFGWTEESTPAQSSKLKLNKDGVNF